MSGVSRRLRRPKAAADARSPTHNAFDEDELLEADVDLQPATTSVQLATAMRSSISSQPQLRSAQQQHRRRPPAQARQPKQPVQQYDEYEPHLHDEPQRQQQQQSQPEEEAYDGVGTVPSRVQQRAFTFKPSQAQRTVRSRAPSYSSSSSSSSNHHPTLTPTSMAAFDPLTTPATRATASRAIAKRSSLTMPSPRSAQPLALLAPSPDPFDAIDPSPPSYEQVLASDDVIAAQFSGMLALEPPAADAAHIKRVAQQEAEQAEQEVADEVDAIMEQVVARPNRAARQSRKAAVRPVVEEYEKEHEYEEVKRSAPVRQRQQHPRYAMSNEEEEELPGDVQQVQRPIPKTARTVTRAPRRQERRVDEEEAEEERVVESPQQPRVARNRQPVVQRQEQLEEEYEPPPPVRSQVRPPVKKTVAIAEEKTARRRSRIESLEWYEEQEELKEVRSTQRRLSADANTAAVPVRNAKPARRSTATDDAESLSHVDRQSIGGKSERISRPLNNKPVIPHPLSASPHIRQKSLSSSASSSSTVNKPYRPRTIKVDALAFMQSGTPFLKYSSSYFSSPPHFRQFILIATTPAYIQWFSQNKALTASRVHLQAITAIATGQTTPTFAKHKAVELESMSFSVLYVEGGRERSLDLTAKDKNELNVWVRGLERMVKFVKKGEELEERKNWKRLLIDLPVVYGGNGSASQPLIDAETGQAVEVRGRNALKGAGGSEVESSLYRDLQPRLQRLEAVLLKRKEEVKNAKGSSVYTVVREKVKRVEGICKLVGDALMDGNLEVADQQLWLGNLELDTVNDMITSAKSER